MSTFRLLLATVAAGAVALPAAADTIYLTDGTTVDEVDIQAEGLSVVAYKKGKTKDEVASDRVLTIEYARSPADVDRALTAVQDEQYFTALDDLEGYIEGVLAKPPRRYPWAPAFAMFTVVEIHEAMGEFGELVKAADRLIEKAPDSRYVPYAFLKKASAQNDLGKASTAQKTLDEFEALIGSKELSKRWLLEHNLARLLYNTETKGKRRRELLQDVAIEASVDFPTVRNRAEVAVGESYLDEKKLSDAEEVFARIAKDPQADGLTLAAAYTGYGDCLFQKGVDLKENGGDAASVLREALKAYMRVVVVYKRELRYVPKAMFYAGRVFQQFEDDESQDRAQKLYMTVMRDFQGSKWADEARGFRR